MASVFDPAFDPPPVSPYRYGTAPWHQRGHVFNSDMAFAERTIPGGVAAVLKRAGDADLERFFKQKFAATAFYDALPGQYFGLAVARAGGMTHDTYLRRVATCHAEEALSGFSGIVLRVLTPDKLAVWLPRIAAVYNDFGTVRTTTVAPRHVRGHRTGVPQFLVGSVARSAMYFLEDILRQAGVKDPVVHGLAPEREGVTSGVTIWSIGFEIRWAE